MERKNLVSVRVTPAVPPKMLTETDRAEVPTWADIRIDHGVDRSLWADVALDVVHDNIAVEVLDDFDFSVFAGDEQLTPALDHDGYSLADKGAIVAVSDITVAHYSEQENSERSAPSDGPQLH